MKIKEIFKSEFFLGSFVLLVLINIGNLINYVFHFSIARMLGPADYGVLAVLTNIIYIFSVPTLSIQTLVSRSTTKFNAQKEFGKIKGILNSLIKDALIMGFILFLIFLLLSVFLAEQLKIPIGLLILTGVLIFISFLSPITMGIFQGMKKFNQWGWNYIINCSLKLIISVILIFFGFRVYGAVIGFILGAFIAFILTFPFIKEILSSQEIKEKINLFSKQSLSVFFTMLMVVLMYSLDIFLVKKFFNADIAGKYAAASLLGKIILFGTGVVGSAMFPISSEKFEKGDPSRDTIKKTFLVVFMMCVFMLLLFQFFSEFIINLLFGSQYLSASNILFYVGVAFAFISLINISVLYKISRNKLSFKHTLFLVFSLLAQTGVLYFMHESIEEFSLVFMFSTIAIFIGLLFLMGILKYENFNNNSSIQ